MCASRLKTRNMRSPRCCACVLFAHLCVGGTGKWYSDYLVVFERSYFSAPVFVCTALPRIRKLTVRCEAPEVYQQRV